jgi:hypothetical protein
LPDSKSLNKVIPVTTQKTEEPFGMVDFYPGRVAIIKGSVFVNSRVVEISPTLVRDSS